MKKLSELGVVESEVMTRNVDTRIIKLRKFKEYDSKKVIDFTINGKNIKETVATEDPEAPKVATGLQEDFSLSEKIKYIQRLLGVVPPDLPSGRVALYMCPIDGDLLCDTVGCRIEFGKDTVTWSDFEWDVDAENDSAGEEGGESKVKGLTTYSFNRKDYEALLNRLIEEYEAGIHR
ncbi:MAG TPA: hypothetical protein VLF69_02195 [Candidatus Saccharimonadales bacterium]|nr:hypothetical protein [Candidatus Saccharimonadales bacterium]